MTKEQLIEDIRIFVAEHNRFPDQTDIPHLPSLRTLQRHGIRVSHFIDKKTPSRQKVEKMQDSTQKIFNSVSELAFLLHNKGYDVKTNQVINLHTNQRTNIVAFDKDTKKKYAIEVVCPASKLSVPTSIRRRIFKFPFDLIDEFETIFIVNINETFNIGYYHPRMKINQKIKLINLSEFPLCQKK